MNTKFSNFYYNTLYQKLINFNAYFFTYLLGFNLNSYLYHNPILYNVYLSKIMAI